MNNTPKEKAIELSMKFDKLGETDNAKQCALISISDKIEELMWLNLLITTDNPIKEVMNNKVEELLQVKQEIELL